MKKVKAAKEKVIDLVASHPKVVAVGTSLAVATTVAVAADFGHLGSQMAFASPGVCSSCRLN